MTLFLMHCLLSLSEHGTKKMTLCWEDTALVASIRPCSKTAMTLLPSHTLSGHAGAVDTSVVQPEQGST